MDRADFSRGGCFSTLLPVFRNQNGKQRSAALRCPAALCPLRQVAEQPWAGTSNFPDSQVDTSASRGPVWSLNRSRKHPLNYRSGSVAESPEILLKNSMHIWCYPKRLTPNHLTATSRSGGADGTWRCTNAFAATARGPGCIAFCHYFGNVFMYSKKIYTSFMNRKPTSWDKTTNVREEGREGAGGPFPGPPQPGYAQPLTESGNGCPGARWRQKASSKGSGRSAIQGRGRKWWGMLYKPPEEFSQEHEGEGHVGQSQGGGHEDRPPARQLALYPKPSAGTAGGEKPMK